MMVVRLQTARDAGDNGDDWRPAVSGFPLLYRGRVLQHVPDHLLSVMMNMVSDGNDHPKFMTVLSLG